LSSNQLVGGSNPSGRAILSWGALSSPNFMRGQGFPGFENPLSRSYSSLFVSKSGFAHRQPAFAKS